MAGMRKSDTATLEKKATEVAALMRMFANQHRLLILCKLVELGEANVGTLADEVDLSPSALSQHLAKLRAQGLVATRRDGQNIYYKLANPTAQKLVGALCELYSK